MREGEGTGSGSEAGGEEAPHASSSVKVPADVRVCVWVCVWVGVLCMCVHARAHMTRGVGGPRPFNPPCPPLVDTLLSSTHTTRGRLG